jgi:hypothetical protein
MASGIARRLIGEAEETPPPSSAASGWFASLGDTVASIIVDGGVDDIEIQATALHVRDSEDGEDGDEFLERTATWEEAQSDISGNWSTVDSPDQPVTAYSIYAHRRKLGNVHISDHKTHEEATTEAHGIAALLGVEVQDLCPANDPRVNEAYGEEFLDDLANKALQPYLKINFLDGDKEEMRIHLVWEKDMFSQGSSFQPGLSLHPSREQLRQIGGPIGGYSGGQFAMEVINSARYEGDERSGFLHDSPEDLRTTAEETPDLYYRPLKYEYVNEGEAPDEMYE